MAAILPQALNAYNADPAEADDGALSFLPLAQALRLRAKQGGLEAGDGSVLPQARKAAASVPAGPVEQARVPNNFGALTQGYDQKIGDYQRQLGELNQDPDYTEMAAASRRRGGEGVQALAASIAAGMGPRDLQPLQQHFAQQSTRLMAPQKVEGGEIDALGNVTIDPGFKRQKQISDLRGAIEHLEKAKLTATTAEEKYRIEEQQNRMMMEFRNAQLQMQKEAHADRIALAHEARAARDDAKNGPLGIKDAAQIEDRMGDDFRAQTKNYVTELDSARKILTLPTDRKWSPIEQQSAIVMLNKILDPNSVVREGEFDRVAQAQGVFQRAGLALQKLQSGATLSPALAKDIRDVAEFYNQASQQRMNTIAQDYSERAGRRGLDARNVTGIYAPKAAPGAPGQPTGVAADYYPNANR
jgi:hypothetical protein